MSRVVPSQESEPLAPRNGFYPHSDFKHRRHRTLALDVGGRLLVVLLLLAGIFLALDVLGALVWAAFWLGEAVIRRFG
jgi:hypothetical protein